MTRILLPQLEATRHLVLEHSGWVILLANLAEEVQAVRSVRSQRCLVRASIVQILKLPQFPFSLSDLLNSRKCLSALLVNRIARARVRPEGREEKDC